MAVIDQIRVVNEMHLCMKYRIEFNNSPHKLNKLLLLNLLSQTWWILISKNKNKLQYFTDNHYQ